MEDIERYCAALADLREAGRLFDRAFEVVRPHPGLPLAARTNQAGILCRLDRAPFRLDDLVRRCVARAEAVLLLDCPLAKGRTPHG